MDLKIWKEVVNQLGVCSVVQVHLSDSFMDKSELQKLKAELELRAQRELDSKLEEVNAYLMEQARARERLDRVRDANEAELRKEFDKMRNELLVSRCYANVFSRDVPIV